MRRRTKSRWTAMGATLATALLLSLGCAGLATAAEPPTDLEISRAVDGELIRDRATPADDILVSTIDGIVTLSGDVDNILAKDRAVTIAETVKGVRGVIDKIEVAPPLRTDEAIQKDVQNALQWDPATDSWKISAESKGGVVTLRGSVDSWQEKELAAKVAKGVRGVKALENDLKVDYDTRRTDAEIQQEIEAALNWDAYVDHALVKVSVKDGSVSLSGTVGSAAEKNRAAAKAWVNGVTSVDNSELQVKWWARDDRLRKNKYVSRPNPEIEAAVKDALRYDPRVTAQAVEVSVEDGYATLRGTVDDLKEKRTAAQDARDVVGVWGVDNALKVRLATPPSDDRIEASVRAALLSDPYVDRYDITVSVVNNDVYLYGDVDSNFEKAQADDVAARQRGVSEVHNFLTVHNVNRYNYDPYVDDWYLYDYDWYSTEGRTTTKTDWEIQQSIQSELFWSPFVDSDQVEVAVDNGTAELTGTVDSWQEREAAEENALEGGAIAVDNDLTVAFGPTYYRP